VGGVEYYISAMDTSGNIATDPEGAPDEYHTIEKFGLTMYHL
jgi:hypothetical protein